MINLPIKGNMLITGGAGRGKTRLLKSMIIASHQTSVTTVLATPTSSAKKEYHLFSNYISRYATGQEEIEREIKFLKELIDKRNHAALRLAQVFDKIILYVDEAGYVLSNLSEQARSDFMKISTDGGEANISIVLAGQGLYAQPEVSRGEFKHDMLINLDEQVISFRSLSILTTAIVIDSENEYTTQGQDC